MQWRRVVRQRAAHGAVLLPSDTDGADDVLVATAGRHVPACAGASRWHVVPYLHGGPGSGLEQHQIPGYVPQLFGVRMISADRPEYGNGCCRPEYRQLVLTAGCQLGKGLATGETGAGHGDVGYGTVSGGRLKGVMTWMDAGAVTTGPSRAPCACMMIWQVRCMSRRRSW
jgi:hypothetical protein